MAKLRFTFGTMGSGKSTQALQEAQCGFFADAGHARDVVHLVTHQGEEIDNQ